MPKLYVAYGSNLNKAQTKDRCPTAKFVGTGIIENYELQFKGSLHNAHATIAPKEGSTVPVGIWRIQELDERRLDMYEGYPNYYFKQDMSHEYRDYLANKTVGNASEFITQLIEENMDAVADTRTYADYIATRPRAERFGSHGLFTDDGVQVQLERVSEELNHYTGHVYTSILSLRREDAARLGFDTGSRWRDFLRSQTPVLAENLKIPLEHLRWYAAYHNEGHHPHVHLIAYSTVPGEGYLSEQGVENIRSEFARDIFAQELICTYEQQNTYRDQLRQQGRESVAQIVEQINIGNFRNERVEELLRTLSTRLARTSGKKQYGYLKSDLKAIVDQIVMELAKDEKSKACMTCGTNSGRMFCVLTPTPSRNGFPWNRTGNSRPSAMR